MPEWMDAYKKMLQSGLMSVNEFREAVGLATVVPEPVQLPVAYQPPPAAYPSEWLLDVFNFNYGQQSKEFIPTLKSLTASELKRKPQVEKVVEVTGRKFREEEQQT